MAIGYKVFTQKNGRLFSVLNFHTFSFKYSKTKPNFPIKGNGPFAVFKTKKAAENFADDLNEYRDYDEFHVVKKIRYVKSRVKSLYYHESGQTIRENYKELCEHNDINIRYADLASKITILE